MEKEKIHPKWLNQEVEGIKARKLALTIQDQNHPSDFTKPQSQISLGQPVYSADQYLLGPVTRLSNDSQHNISHLVVATRRVFRMNKAVPVHFIVKVGVENIQLSIFRGMFNALRNHREDSAIAEDIHHVLWMDPVLRTTDYDRVDFQVRDGTVFLRGQVISQMNQACVMPAVRRVEGIIDMVNHLVSDDELTRDVAGALGAMEQLFGTKFFTRAQNGVIFLSGEVSSVLERSLAERCAAAHPHVRGMINHIRAPEVNEDAEDHRFLQPAIGQQIYFQDGQSRNVSGVIIHPDNRRVSYLVVREWFKERLSLSELANAPSSSREQMVVIPIRTVQHLTRSSGQIAITAREALRLQSETPPVFSLPPPDWVPPYPYHRDAVLFSQSNMLILAHLPELVRAWVPELATYEGA